MIHNRIGVVESLFVLLNNAAADSLEGEGYEREDDADYTGE